MVSRKYVTQSHFVWSCQKSPRRKVDMASCFWMRRNHDWFTRYELVSKSTFKAICVGTILSWGRGRRCGRTSKLTLPPSRHSLNSRQPPKPRSEDRGWRIEDGHSQAVGGRTPVGRVAGRDAALRRPRPRFPGFGGRFGKSPAAGKKHGWPRTGKPPPGRRNAPSLSMV